MRYLYEITHTLMAKNCIISRTYKSIDINMRYNIDIKINNA